jgi:hypothetical protein
MGCLSPVKAWLLIALLGCERADKATPRTKTVEIARPQVKVVVKDPGAEPRSLLRIHATPRSTQYEFVVTTVDTWDGAAPQHRKMTMREERKVDEVRADGSFHELSIWRELAFEGEGAAESTQKMKPMIGAEFAAWIDNRGHMLDNIVLTVDEHTDPTGSTDNNSEGSIVLPDVAVGIGARWEMVIDTVGERSIVEATLVRRTGDALDVTTEFTHRGGPYEIEATGTGEFHLDLATGPSWGTIRERARMHIVDAYLTRTSTKTARPVP